jgi:FRG domain-containing protein
MQTTKTTTQGLKHSLVVVDEWQDLLEVFQELETGWVFRGQERGWALEPSLRRYASGMDHVEAEDAALSAAKRRIHHYLPTEHTPANIVEWLALIQH